MADCKAFQQYLKTVPALGRNFQLGDFYNYSTDQIAKKNLFLLEPSVLASATGTDNTNQFRKTRSNDGEFANDSKTQSMGLDNHTLASVVAGLIHGNQGASNFLNDVPDPAETTLTLSWTLKSKEKFIDLKFLMDHASIPTPTNEAGAKSDATHIVVRVTYGADIHCVLAQNISGRENDEETRQRAHENLSNMATKLEDALSENKDLAKFKLGLSKEEKHQSTRLKCRLYADFQTQPVRECNIFDAYNQIDRLFKHVLRTKDQSKTVPVAFQLCPLKVLFDPMPKFFLYQFHNYREVKFKYVNPFCRISADLKRAIIRAEKMFKALPKRDKDNGSSSVREFINTISNRQEHLQSLLKKSIVLARDFWNERNDLKDIAEKAEKHLLFKLTQLELWLDMKLAEFNMMDSIVNEVSGKEITILTDQNKLESQLNEIDSTRKYSLVLHVPPLDEWTKTVISEMKQYNKLDGPWRIDYGQPWHTIPSKRKCVLDIVRELANHVGKDQQMSNQIQWIVTFSESSQTLKCKYSIYEAASLVKSNLDQLPDPPTGLQIHHPITNVAKKAKKDSSSIAVEWDYRDLGYPYHFLIEYRPKGSSDPWIQRRTTGPNETQLAISFPTGTSLEIRVAAETCIGRSDFSDVIDMDDAAKEVDEAENIFNHCPKENDQVVLRPPSDAKVTSVRQDAAKFEWTPSPEDHCCLCYRVSWWKKTKNPSSAQEQEIGYNLTSFSCCDLEPETTYMFNIATITTGCSRMDPPLGETIEFTTTKSVRFAETLVDRCQKVGNEGGLDLYAIPLIQTTGQLKTAERFVFDANGESNRQLNGCPRTILLVGASDSGKTLLINSFINYIFGVNLEDPFRFQLIDRTQEGVLKKVTIYDIHHSKEFRISESLKIIDTPSYNKDPVENQVISKIISNFFDEKIGVQEVDMVCFVMDSSAPHLSSLQIYIFCSLLTIFGNDLKQNITFLMTSADREDSSLRSSIVEFGLVTYGPSVRDLQRCYKVNNSVYFRPNKEFGSVVTADSGAWMDDFDLFFTSLKWITTKSVSLSKQLEDEKSRLNASIFEIQERLKTELAKFEQLCQMHKNIYYRENEEFAQVVAKKVTLLFGEHVTNCNECEITCHSVCGIEGGKVNCDVMDRSMPEESRRCLVCPGHCLWSSHSSDPYRWCYVNETTTLDALRKEGEASGEKTKIDLMVLIVGTQAKKLEIVDVIESVANLIQQLSVTAKRLGQKSTGVAEKSLDIIVKCLSSFLLYENKEPQPGYEERIKRLHRLRLKIHQLTNDDRFRSFIMFTREEIERMSSLSSGVLESEVEEIYSRSTEVVNSESSEDMESEEMNSESSEDMEGEEMNSESSEEERNSESSEEIEDEDEESFEYNPFADAVYPLINESD